MKKHEITAYTLEEGDTLYYAEDGKIKKIDVEKENFADMNFAENVPEDTWSRWHIAQVKPLIDGIFLKPGGIVRESENGRLILWERIIVKDFKDKRRIHANLSLKYAEVETDIAINAEVLRRDLIAEHMTQLSELFEEI